MMFPLWMIAVYQFCPAIYCSAASSNDQFFWFEGFCLFVFVVVVILFSLSSPGLVGKCLAFDLRDLLVPSD